jgi:MFS family permease
MGTGSRIERNVAKNYLFVFLSSTSLSEAMWVLYLAFRGMSLIQIGLIESVFHLTSVLMEVPTGIVADRFGRKTSRLLGRAVAMVATLLMIGSRSFWGFALAFVFTALGYNLESGAGDALVYDSLLQCGKQDRFIVVKGRQEVAYQAARIVSLVASGIVATFDYTLA